MVVLATAGAPAAWGSSPPAAAPAKPAPARSVFVMPAGPQQGRDPFFPESTRPYEEIMASKHTVEPLTFTVNGLSVEGGQPMVIINNQTFAVGDEGDVRTGGKQVHIRLVEIRDGIAVIEVNGTRRELSTTIK